MWETLWNILGTLLFFGVFGTIGYCLWDYRQSHRRIDEALRLLSAMGYSEEELGYIDLENVIQQIARLKKQTAQGTVYQASYIQVRFIGGPSRLFRIEEGGIR